MTGRSRDRGRDDAGIADAADLFALALDAGLTVGAALPLVAAALRGQVHDALTDAARRVDAGEPLDDALGGLVTSLGDGARPLVDALVSHVRYGLPVRAALDRAAFELRQAERRALEARARRLPVTLLFPLVLCSLPAFVLLSVVPLVVAAVSSLRS